MNPDTLGDGERYVTAMPNGAHYLREGDRFANLPPGLDPAERDARIAAFFDAGTVAPSPAAEVAAHVDQQGNRPKGLARLAGWGRSVLNLGRQKPAEDGPVP